MKQKLLSINTTTGDYASFVERLTDAALQGNSTYTCVANVHMLVEAHKDPEFARVVNEADMVTPDGMPLAVSMKLIHGLKQDRVAGMDLLPDLLQVAQEQHIPVFFYGGTQDMLDKTADYCNRHFPHLPLAGMYSPPFRALTPQEEEEVISRINGSGACFVFVALGCPKQEKWMAAMKGRVKACMIGIGGALPVMIGMQRRAPRWMQTLCLEWLYRLAQEPGRLFKRYAVTNTTFLFLLTRTWMRQGFRPLQPKIK